MFGIAGPADFSSNIKGSFKGPECRAGLMPCAADRRAPPRFAGAKTNAVEWRQRGAGARSGRHAQAGGHVQGRSSRNSQHCLSDAQQVLHGPPELGGVYSTFFWIDPTRGIGSVIRSGPLHCRDNPRVLEEFQFSIPLTNNT
jgi:hypothetical protein